MSAEQISNVIAAHMQRVSPAPVVAEESLEVRLHAMKMQRQAAFAAALGLRVA